MLPAALSVLVIVGVLLLPRLGHGQGARRRTPRSCVRAATRDAAGGRRRHRRGRRLLRTGDPRILGGAIGYWAFDNAVLWATFHAFGVVPPLTIVLMGYLIGQLGGLLPLPGGVGGIDGGLIGTLVVFGAPAAATAAAVLAYRVILFWLPLIGGAVAFASLRRELGRPRAAGPLRAAHRRVRTRLKTGPCVGIRRAGLLRRVPSAQLHGYGECDTGCRSPVAKRSKRNGCRSVEWPPHSTSAISRPTAIIL